MYIIGLLVRQFQFQKAKLTHLALQKHITTFELFTVNDQKTAAASSQ